MGSGAHTVYCPVYGVEYGVEPTRRDSVAHSMPRPRAQIDAARTTDENRKHWENADALNAVSQLTPGVRKILRDRCRYEVQNNTYCGGLIRTLVNDTVGRGPRLEMMTDDKRLNAEVMDAWREWALASDWALNMRILAGVRYVAGETFGIFRNSKRLEQMGLPVSLDIRLIEPDQIGRGWNANYFNPTGDDGIDCDEDGEVIAYKILRVHPGDNRPLYGKGKVDTVSAADVLHWFEPTRPGQLRGVTPLAAALPIFSQLRRYSSATLTSAEVAAMLAGVLESDDFAAQSSGSNSVSQEQFFDTTELVRGTLLTLPPGVKATQFKPEQPTSNFDMFTNAKLRECGRLINVPFGKMAGDHSQYNYSSGRLDDAPYWSDRDIERDALEVKVFNPTLYRWCDFARYAIPALSAYRGRWHQLKHRWHYDSRPSSDPVKDATGDGLNLTNGADTLTAIAARDGTTLGELLDQRAAEKAAFEERGLPLPPWMTGAPAKPQVGDGMPQNPGDAKAYARRSSASVPRDLDESEIIPLEVAA